MIKNRTRYNYYALCALVGMLSACSTDNLGTVAKYPPTEDDRELEHMGRLTGEAGLEFTIGEKGSNNAVSNNITSVDNRTQVAASSSNQKSYAVVPQYKGDKANALWQAALDVTKGIPLLSTDMLGGVIITDWYAENSTINVRHKFCIYITEKAGGFAAVSVTTFKQVFDGTTWHDVRSEKTTASTMEKKIVAKANML